MMTMTTLMAAKTPPQCLPIIMNIATSSQPLDELIVVKYGTCDIDSTQNNSLPVLQGIPMGISLPSTTATAIDCHVDDDASHPPQPCPSLFPTMKETNSTTSLLPPPSAVDDSFDYWSKLIKISAKIDQMRQQWLLPSPIDQGHPIFPCNTSLSPPNLPTNNAPFDYKSQLAVNEAAIKRMKQCWPLPLQPINPGPFKTTASNMSASSSPPCHPPSTTSTQTIPPAHRAVASQSDTHHCQTVASSPVSAAQPSTAAMDDITNPTLLDAAKTLDNFLLQYPQKLNLPAHLPSYQPSPNHGLSLCCHALLAQQMAVLHTINMLLGKLCEKVTRLIDAKAINTAPSCILCIPSNHTVFHSPQPHPTHKPAASMLQLLFSTGPLQTLAPRRIQLPVNKLTNYQIPIPATTHTTSAHNKPWQLWTKDHLRLP